jgi:hypothetical protein
LNPITYYYSSLFNVTILCHGEQYCEVITKGQVISSTFHAVEPALTGAA